MHHIQTREWLFTPEGTPRGYIQPQMLRELWFHTGTICNLQCPFCLEGSKPGDNRLERLTLADARPFVDEALELGVEQFSFTGGEPFVIGEIMEILGYALERRPCLILTNGTKPLLNRLPEILELRRKPHPLIFRISLDYPDPAKHDADRGEGNFQRALQALGRLHQAGFQVSLARRAARGEDRAAVERAYQPFLAAAGLPHDLHVVAFPEFFPPSFSAQVPYVTTNCMTTYKDEKSRAAFMCNYSKMVVKMQGRMCVYACTLVDDDPDYNLGSTLAEAMRFRIMLRHHRCFACFSYGASCSN